MIHTYVMKGISQHRLALISTDLITRCFPLICGVMIGVSCMSVSRRMQSMKKVRVSYSRPSRCHTFILPLVRPSGSSRCFRGIICKRFNLRFLPDVIARELLSVYRLQLFRSQESLLLYGPSFSTILCSFRYKSSTWSH